MKSKIRCMLASIFERFGLLFGAKLGWKIHQKLAPEGVENMIPKRRELNRHRNSKKSHLGASWERLDQMKRPRRASGEVNALKKPALASQGRPPLREKKLT